MLRAGPFSDERIMRLTNRRFVPFYFDLSNRGFAGDADAREFVVKVRPEYGGASVPTPDVLLMTSEGKLVGQVSNYASADEVLAEMMRVLRAHPAYNKPGQEERSAQTAVEKARILIDLQDYAGARKLLRRDQSQQGLYLLGRLARFDRDWEAMERAFARITRKDLLDDVQMERAYRFWHGGKFEQLREHLQGFDRKSNRYTEARYFEGLALYHSSRTKQAAKTWAKTVRSCSQDPWIYRCDWAYCNAKQSGRRIAFSAGDQRTSLLNRIGYMGRRNPDLDR